MTLRCHGDRYFHKILSKIGYCGLDPRINPLCGAVWREILVKEYEKKLDFTDNIEYHFTCPVCQSLPAEPVTTACRHSMCGPCLTHAMR